MEIEQQEDQEATMRERKWPGNYKERYQYKKKKPSTCNVMTNRLRGTMVRERGFMRKFQRKGSKNAKIQKNKFLKEPCYLELE